MIYTDNASGLNRRAHRRYCQHAFEHGIFAYGVRIEAFAEGNKRDLWGQRTWNLAYRQAPHQWAAALAAGGSPEVVG